MQGIAQGRRYSVLQMQLLAGATQPTVSQHVAIDARPIYRPGHCRV